MEVQANSRSVIDLQANKRFSRGYTSAILSTFGENLTRLRKAAKLKGFELAARANVTPPVVSGWENNRGGLPETPTLFKLANALGCSIEELLEGVDPKYDAARRRARNHDVHVPDVQPPPLDLAKAISNPETAAAVRAFLELREEFREWVLSAPPEMRTTPPPDDGSRIELSEEVRTRRTRGQRR
jgi:transcriptional regulator with XRE-family HTH domain